MLPSINFASIPAQGNPGIADFINNIYQGYENASIPQQIQNQEKLAKLRQAEAQQSIQQLMTQNKFLPDQLRANLSLTLLQNQFMPKMQNAQLGLLGEQLKGAQIENQFAPQLNSARINALNAQQNLYKIKAAFGGGALTGNVGDAIKLNNLKNMVGENNPAYQAGLAAYQTNLRRFATTPARIANDLADAKAGFMPGTGRSSPLQGADQQDAINNLTQALLKNKTDSQTRQKALYAANIDKTLAMIDPKALTQYGGALGTSERLAQKGLASLGLESSNYDAYSNQLSAVQRLASQVRQFYGDSVIPSNVERLLNEFNTGSFFTNPKLAQQKFNTLKNILNKETQTYRNALNNAREYQNSTSSSSGAVWHDLLGLRQ